MHFKQRWEGLGMPYKSILAMISKILKRLFVNIYAPAEATEKRLELNLDDFI